jgi:signal transduction histidine kinase
VRGDLFSTLLVAHRLRSPTDRPLANACRRARAVAEVSHSRRLSKVRCRPNDRLTSRQADLALSAQRSAGTYKRALEAIAIEAEAMERLTRDLLSTVRRGDDSAPEGWLDLGDLARSATARLRILADRRGVAIDVDAGATAEIVARAGALEQALVAIIHNAIKFASSRIDVAGSGDPDGTVVISIADDGTGFSRSALENACDRFWRDGGPSPDAGYGLGLSIARSIVERSGGTMTLSNSSDGGAIVSLRFPAAISTVSPGPTQGTIMRRTMT